MTETSAATNSRMENAPFIKHLASSDRPTREKAVAALRAYLGSRRQHTERDFLFLWKGLFYCMWHSDRPRPQQLLAHDLSELITPLEPAVAWMFWRAFWKTIIREWNGIDQLRIDKYLLLVRREVAAALRYCKKHGWETEQVETMVGIIEEGPMHPREAKVPNGLRYHMCDIWVDELEKVREKGEALPWELLERPWVAMKKDGAQKVWRVRAGEVLVDGRLLAWKDGREFGEEKEGEGEKMEEDGEEEFKGFD